MREISNLELSVLVERLKPLAGTYVDKFYDLGNGKFVLKLSSKGIKASLLCILLHTLHVTAYTEKYGEPSNFAVAVRKRISGYKVSGIEKVNEDRIVRMSLEKGESRVSLIFEMFGKGNLIVLDENDRIMLAHSYDDFRGRSVRPRSEYKPPDNRGADLLSCSKDEVRGIMQKHDDAGIMSFLSKWTNIGILYIENAVLTLGIGPNDKVGTLREGIWHILDEISKEMKEAEKGAARIYLKDGKIEDYALCDIKKYASLERIDFDDLGKAMDFIYMENAEKAVADNPAIERLKKSIDKQKRILAGIDEQISRNTGMAQAIFNNMNVLNQIIDVASHNRHVTGKDLEAMLEGTCISIKSVDLKSKRIAIVL